MPLREEGPPTTPPPNAGRESASTFLLTWSVSTETDIPRRQINAACARERDDLHGDYGGAEYTQIGVEETLTGSTRERRSGTEDRAIRSARRRPVKTRLLVAGGIAVVSVILVSGQS